MVFLWFASSHHLPTGGAPLEFQGPRTDPGGGVQRAGQARRRGEGAGTAVTEATSNILLV